MSKTIGIHQVCEMIAPSLYHMRCVRQDEILSALRSAIRTLKEDGFVLHSKPSLGYSITRVHYELKRYEKTNGNKDTGLPIHH